MGGTLKHAPPVKKTTHQKQQRPHPTPTTGCRNDGTQRRAPVGGGIHSQNRRWQAAASAEDGRLVGVSDESMGGQPRQWRVVPADSGQRRRKAATAATARTGGWWRRRQPLLTGAGQRLAVIRGGGQGGGGGEGRAAETGDPPVVGRRGRQRAAAGRSWRRQAAAGGGMGCGWQ